VLSAGSADPNHCIAVSPTYPAALKAEMMRRNLDPAGGSTARSLIAHFQSGAADTAVLNAGRNYRAMPLIVLTAGAQQPLPPGAPPEATAELPRFGTVWGRAHDALAALSSAGVNRTVPGATHNIQVQKPEVVIAAIREVVEATRRR
jgi:pimeloyl-ACP methyl ester carboxylesterase